MRSGPSSRAPSPSSSPRLARAALNGHSHSHSHLARHTEDQLVTTHGVGHGQGHGTALVAAQRILALATESLDMMRGVMGVVGDSLDRADAWVGRLRTVGIQRGAQEGDEDAFSVAASEYEAEFSRRRSALPHPANHAPTHNNQPNHRTHHRSHSSLSQFSDIEMDLDPSHHDHDLDAPSSPFLPSSSSSTAWGSTSSVPGTPGGGAGYEREAGMWSPGSGAGAGAIGIGGMRIASRGGRRRGRWMCWWRGRGCEGEGRRRWGWMWMGRCGVG
ncbi:hypothetical protein B0H34DRAFT_705656 [Crassisporium funariophilum]|nr:hypothetical protein B0H34DRAFT_705656 [Crassisporium funariophilum]